MLRPYTELRPATGGVPVVADGEYPVQMVGHHDEFVHGDGRKMRRDLEPIN